MGFFARLFGRRQQEEIEPDLQAMNAFGLVGLIVNYQNGNLPDYYIDLKAARKLVVEKASTAIECVTAWNSIYDDEDQALLMHKLSAIVPETPTIELATALAQVTAPGAEQMATPIIVEMVRRPDVQFSDLQRILSGTANHPAAALAYYACKKLARTRGEWEVLFGWAARSLSGTEEVGKLADRLVTSTNHDYEAMVRNAKLLKRWLNLEPGLDKYLQRVLSVALDLAGNDPNKIFAVFFSRRMAVKFSAKQQKC